MPTNTLLAALPPALRAFDPRGAAPALAVRLSHAIAASPNGLSTLRAARTRQALSMRLSHTLEAASTTFRSSSLSPLGTALIALWWGDGQTRGHLPRALHASVAYDVRALSTLLRALGPGTDPTTHVDAISRTLQLAVERVAAQLEDDATAWPTASASALASQPPSHAGASRRAPADGASTPLATHTRRSVSSITEGVS